MMTSIKQLRKPLICYAILWAMLTLLYSFAVRFLAPSSDQGSVLLEAHAMLQGNILLKGWNVPSDNFVANILPLYAVALKIIGVSPTVWRIIPGALYALLVCLMVGLTCSGLTGRKLRIGAFFIVVLIAFPSSTSSYPQMMILFTEHIATVIGILISWVWIRYEFARRLVQNEKLETHIAVFGVLSWCILVITTLSDPFVLFLFTIPFCMYGIVALVRKTEEWFWVRCGLWLISATIAGFIADVVIKTVGGFTITAPLTHFATWSMLGSLFARFEQYFFFASGSYFWGGSVRSLGTIASLIHGIVALALVCAVISTLYRWIRYAKGETIDVILALGFAVTTAALLLSQQLQSGTERYVLIMYLMAVPLCVRWVLENVNVSKIAAWCAPAAVIIVAVAYVGAFVPAIVKPSKTYNTISSYLIDNHLQYGVSSYDLSAVLTVETNGQSSIYPVYYYQPLSSIVPQLFLADRSWFTAQHSGNWFAIWIPGSGTDGITENTLEKSFGRPVSVTHIGIYAIGIWTYSLGQRVYSNLMNGDQQPHLTIPPLDS